MNVNKFHALFLLKRQITNNQTSHIFTYKEPKGVRRATQLMSTCGATFLTKNSSSDTAHQLLRIDLVPENEYDPVQGAHDARTVYYSAQDYLGQSTHGFVENQIEGQPRDCARYRSCVSSGG